MTKDMKQPSKRQSLTEEEALRNARELIEEEELEKVLYVFINGHSHLEIFTFSLIFWTFENVYLRNTPKIF